MKDNKLIIFQGKTIRRTLVNDEWFFSVVDVVAALTDSLDPGAYWRKLKQRMTAEGSQIVTFCHGLKLHYSQTGALGAGLPLQFETPIKLHYSQTRGKGTRKEPKFETPIKLHYSQTTE